MAVISNYAKNGGLIQAVALTEVMAFPCPCQTNRGSSSPSCRPIFIRVMTGRSGRRSGRITVSAGHVSNFISLAMRIWESSKAKR